MQVAIPKTPELNGRTLTTFLLANWGINKNSINVNIGDLSNFADIQKCNVEPGKLVTKILLAIWYNNFSNLY